REGEKNGVACRYIGNRNAVRHLGFWPIFRHINVAGQRRTSKLPQVEGHHRMLHAEQSRQSPGCAELNPMTLAIIEAQSVRCKSIAARDGERRCRIKAAT